MKITETRLIASLAFLILVSVVAGQAVELGAPPPLADAQFRNVSTRAVIIISGGSQFSAAEDGTPLHITYVKVGTAYVQKISEATDAELANLRRSRADFTPKTP